MTEEIDRPLVRRQGDELVCPKCSGKECEYWEDTVSIARRDVAGLDFEGHLQIEAEVAQCDQIAAYDKDARLLCL